VSSDSVLTNKQIIRRWFDRVWNQRDERMVHELMAKDCIAHGLGPDPLVGPEGFMPFYRAFVSAMPDLRISIEDLLEEDDRVVARWTATGTLTGEGLGVKPTGRRASMAGMTIGRIANGQLVEGWNTFDMLDMHQQLGTVSQLQAP
jgi:steroid delta-isomerase-like uncharacterized protein